MSCQRRRRCALRRSKRSSERAADLFIVACALLLSPVAFRGCHSLALPSSGGPSSRPLGPKGLVRTVSEQYRLRTCADPDFARKSVLEVFVAAGTQLAAETNRRGGLPGLVRDVDFVFAGVLTAVAGKYYSMWKVAPTADKDGIVVASVDESGTTAVAAATAAEGDRGGSSFWSTEVPTNAFQTYLLDGRSRPTVIARLAALVAPVPSLFLAGVGSGAIGYGLTAALVWLRTQLLPDYVARTVSVNVVHACLYTGGFLALVSNLRYQLLQGVIEPRIIDKALARYPKARAAATFAVRLANGLLGSILGITGMRLMGLQKLK